MDVFLLLCCIVSAANCFGLTRAGYGLGNSQAGLSQDVLNRLARLEEAVQSHPAELDALRRELYAEMNDMRTVHAQEISKLRNSFQVEVEKVRAENEHMLADTKESHEEELLAVKAKCQQEADNENDIGKQPFSRVRNVNPTEEFQNDTSRLKDATPPREAIKQDSTHHLPRARRQEGELVVAFFATLSRAISHLGTDQDIVFDHVVTNTGNAYDSHHGIFRPPVAGLYVFSTTVLAIDRDRTHAGFVLNGSKLTRMFLNGPEKPGDSASNTIVVHLNQGDDISVQNFESDKTIQGENESIFSGFLLAQDFPLPTVIGK